jgi:hypothetical protein
LASLLAKDLLQREYLEPMRREVRSARAMLDAPFPEYWWDEHQAAVLAAVYAGDHAQADALITCARPRVQEDIGKVLQALGEAGHVKAYAAWWRKRAAASAADWTKLIDQRRGQLQERVADYDRTVAPLSELLKNMNDPPVQAGTRAWEKRNRVLTTVTPADHEQFWGNWIGGLTTFNGQRVAAFAVERHLPTNAGAFSELPIELPISGRRDRLALVVYLADANKESFGLGYAKWRWSGTRAIRLLAGDREVWSADLGIPRLTGEWFIVPLPAVPPDVKTLPLRLRVEDYYSAKNNLEIVYVGPIHLIELDRD